MGRKRKRETANREMGQVANLHQVNELMGQGKEHQEAYWVTPPAELESGPHDGVYREMDGSRQH